MAGRQLPPGQFSSPPARDGQDAVGASDKEEQWRNPNWLSTTGSKTRSDREEAFPFPNIADHLSHLSVGKISSALDGADASRLAAEANRHLPPFERLSDRDDMALHPAGAWDLLRILRDVLSTFGAAGLPASSERAQLLQD